jgi:hypothetical protein
VNFMRLLLLLSLILSGCGRPPNTIDPAFQPLYNQFVSDASSAGIDLSGNQGITIQFAKLEQPTSLGEIVGECSNVGYGNDTVLIDTVYWNTADLTSQTVLLLHELAHCLLDEIHVSDPNAIMNAQLGVNIQYYFNNPSPSLSVLFSDKGNGGQ